MKARFIIICKIKHIIAHNSMQLSQLCTKFNYTMPRSLIVGVQGPRDYFIYNSQYGIVGVQGPRDYFIYNSQYGIHAL